MEEELGRIATTLENIEGYLKMMAVRPESLKKLESRVEKAVEVKTETEETVAKFEETTVEVTEEVNSVEVSPESLQEGIRVVVKSENAKNGVVGTIVKKSRAWVRIIVETGNKAYTKGESLAARPAEVEILTDAGENATGVEAADTPNEIPVSYEQSTEDSHAGNVRFDRGKYTGRSIHEIYTDEGEHGIKFLKYISKSPIYGEEMKESIKTYLSLRGEEIED